MKKIVLSLAVVFAMGMVACGGSEKKADDSANCDSNVQPEAVMTDSPANADSTPAEVEEPATETQAPAATEKKSSKTTTTTTTTTKKGEDKSLSQKAEEVKQAAEDTRTKVEKATEDAVDQGKNFSKKVKDKIKNKQD